MVLLFTLYSKKKYRLNTVDPVRSGSGSETLYRSIYLHLLYVLLTGQYSFLLLDIFPARRDIQGKLCLSLFHLQVHAVLCDGAGLLVRACSLSLLAAPHRRRLRCVRDSLLLHGRVEKIKVGKLSWGRGRRDKRALLNQLQIFTAFDSFLVSFKSAASTGVLVMIRYFEKELIRVPNPDPFLINIFNLFYDNIFNRK